MRNKSKTKVSIHTWAQTILAIVAIFFAAISYCTSEESIDISLKAIEDANIQHKQDSINSQKLFEAQYEIITSQLEVSKKQYEEILRISKPDFQFDLGAFSSYHNGKNRVLEFTLNILNNGKRQVSNIQYQCFFLNDEINKEYKVPVKGVKILEPGAVFDTTFQYSLVEKETYLYFKILYYDNKLKEYNFQDLIYYFNKDAESFYFNNCNINDIPKIRAYIKKKYHFNPLITPASIEPIKNFG